MKTRSSASYVERKAHNYANTTLGDMQKGSFCMYIWVNIHAPNESYTCKKHLMEAKRHYHDTTLYLNGKGLRDLKNAVYIHTALTSFTKS